MRYKKLRAVDLLHGAFVLLIIDFNKVLRNRQVVS